jgi:glutathione synthase/RimK-type ligase-like ATP-grasp enzyme
MPINILFRPGILNWGKTREAIDNNPYIQITTKTQFNPNDVVINWGGRTPLEGGTVLNPPEKIENAANKILTFKLCGEFMPQTFLEYSTNIQEPFVAKKLWTHKGYGKRKFKKHTNKTQQLSQQYDFFQEFIPIEKEYRVLVFWNGQRYTIPRIYEKVKTGESSPREIFHPSWDFQKIALSEVDERIRQMALEVIHRLELHLIGLDIVISQDGSIYLIEANSAPGLGANTLSKLVQRLQENMRINNE